jgi:hypothetical protein
LDWWILLHEPFINYKALRSAMNASISLQWLEYRSVLCCIIFFVLRFVFPMLLVSISRVSILDCTFGFLCVYQPSNWFYFFFMILPCIRLRYSNHCKHILAFIALLRALTTLNIKRWVTWSPPKKPGWIHVLANGKQFLLLIRHIWYCEVWLTSCQWYSKQTNIRKREEIHGHLSLQSQNGTYVQKSDIKHGQV